MFYSFNNHLFEKGDGIIGSANVNWVRYINLTQTSGGTITAIPLSGRNGDNINLSYTANNNYIWNGWSNTGGNIQGNTFTFDDSDANIQGNFKQDPNPLNLPPYTIRIKSNTTSMPPNPTALNPNYTVTRVSDYVFDYYFPTKNWGGYLSQNITYAGNYFDQHLVAILGANAEGVSSINNLVGGTPITSIAYFDTESVVDATHFIQYTNNLKTIPNYNFKSLKNGFRVFFATGLTAIDRLYTPNLTSTFDMFYSSMGLKKAPVLDTEKVVNMSGMFDKCWSLTSVPLYNTSAVTSMGSMFEDNQSIRHIPLFDTRNVVNFEHFCHNPTTSQLQEVPLLNTSKTKSASYMFDNNPNVTGGALALYTQMSTQPNPPISYGHAFGRCGQNTQTGSAELAQIPSDWK